MLKGNIDWKAKAEIAAGMTDAEIHWAMLDIIKTLHGADAIDREDGGDRGGYYRDESSIYRAERRKRTEAAAKAARKAARIGAMGPIEKIVGY